jgi:hypothetical protein
MDLITTSIAGALANLSSSIIKDAYEALKTAIAEKCGIDSDVKKAVEKLEEKPGSSGRREVLEEEIQSANIDQDPQINELAQKLLQAIRDQQEGQKAVTIKQKAGNNAIQIGEVKGNVDIKR